MFYLIVFNKMQFKYLLKFKDFQKYIINPSKLVIS